MSVPRNGVQDGTKLAVHSRGLAQLACEVWNKTVDGVWPHTQTDRHQIIYVLAKMPGFFPGLP